EVLQTCNDPLGKLYAAHVLLDKFEDADLVRYLQVVRQMTSVQGSPYYDEFERRIDAAALQYDLTASGSRQYWLALILACLIAASWWIITRRRRSGNEAVIMSLSVQERKVFELLASGRSNKEISSELNIGVSTVKSHVHRIYTKLGINSRREVFKFRQYLD
ncbi:MAG: helix-turn-helix transcriptional regulator, partial [Saprospiraceae bacterium]|nr:helix-turn-helix transcriptional regulator [Saprospiraceae bacterium]